MYVRQIKDQTLNFRVSGKLWMRSLIMSDVETETEWSHLLGEAMAGKLKGETLTPIVSDMLTWSAWRKLHPNTTVMNLPRSADKFTSEIYQNPERFVCGFIAGGNAYALPLTLLIDDPVHSFTAADTPYVTVFDQESTAIRIFAASTKTERLTFKAHATGTMQDAQTNSIWDRQTGEAIEGPLKGQRLQQYVAIMSFRQAWRNFHPESTDVK